MRTQNGNQSPSPPWTKELQIRLTNMSRIRGPLHYRRSIASTQEEALALASEGTPEGTIVIASEQTKGRGRHGRKWFSEAGGLWMSVVLRPRVPAQETTLITLMAALGVVKALLDLPVPNPCISWPNDIRVGKAKVAGVLSEAVFSGHQLSHVVLGLGLNANNPLDSLRPTLEQPIASIQEILGHPVSLGEVAHASLQQFDNLYVEANRNGFTHLLPSVKTYMVTLGRRVVIVLEEGECSGIATDLSPNGDLLVKDRNGRLLTVRAEFVKQVSLGNQEV